MFEFVYFIFEIARSYGKHAACFVVVQPQPSLTRYGLDAVSLRWTSARVHLVPLDCQRCVVDGHLARLETSGATRKGSSVLLGC